MNRPRWWRVLSNSVVGQIRDGLLASLDCFSSSPKFFFIVCFVFLSSSSQRTSHQCGTKIPQPLSHRSLCPPKMAQRTLWAPARAWCPNPHRKIFTSLWWKTGGRIDSQCCSQSFCACVYMLTLAESPAFVCICPYRCGLNSNTLTFQAKMITTDPVDRNRVFISFFLSADSMSVFEQPQRNSGRNIWMLAAAETHFWTRDANLWISG